MNKEIKFVSSYSGGKDGVLALYRAIKSGYEPVRLLTTYNENAGRSWFHGVPVEILNKVSQLIDIPLDLVKTGVGDDYTKDFEKALLKLKDNGINACVFGDIDIQAHYDWCDSRCKVANIESIFPLWNESRKELVYEFIESGFKAVITIVDSSRLSERFLGRTLTKELMAEIVAEGADICGEDGEYHTFVYDGPLFKESIDFKFDEIIRNGNYSILPLLLE
ncbi:diphthine--ammonia ligase [Proteiniborus sp. MB09-C3]|uniref:Dph6-related ATP pyrophosphatase n=1 Tax=Proteiniborus sp. MB09-C3 TaxID=3050072 RepID=UPI0025555AC1|nr:diphthine--ammonia ligase [Proteiniborus sp. MB09-C3]WIV12924.1 diphthine--ammonia ligase [Proteiniborus sp. MB09-C3]